MVGQHGRQMHPRHSRMHGKWKYHRYIRYGSEHVAIPQRLSFSYSCKIDEMDKVSVIITTTSHHSETHHLRWRQVETTEIESRLPEALSPSCDQ